MDYPRDVSILPPAIHCGGSLSLPAFGASTLGFGTLTAAAWSTQHRIVYIPFLCPAPAVVKRMAWTNGTVSGNVDAGIYRADFTKVVSTGSVAQSGASSQQFGDMTDTAIPPGLYYMAMQMDNTTGQLLRSNGSAANADRGRATGLCEELAGSFGLPATGTPTAWSVAYLPIVAVEVGRLL